jgi:hypothetical protein
MLLEARSLALEHRYHALRMNTHDIRLHDFGTVCGLRVDKHPAPQCVNEYAILRPGLALDCCGREIVVPEDLFVPLVDGATSGWCGAAMGTLANASATQPAERATKLYISLRYAQCDTDPIPTYVRACGCCGPCEHGGCTLSVTREGYEVVVSSKAPVPWVNPVGKAFCEWLDTKINGPGSSAPALQLSQRTLAEVLCNAIIEPCADVCAGGNDLLLLATVTFDADGVLTGIDNVTDRRLVISTGAIVEALACLTRTEIACCAATDAYLSLGATVTPTTVNLAAPPANDALAYTVTATNTDAHKSSDVFDLGLAFQSGGLSFSGATLTVGGTAQPAPAGSATGVTVPIPALAPGQFAQLVVTATFDPAQHQAGDSAVAVASITDDPAAHDPNVTCTTTFVNQPTDGPRVVLTGWLAPGTAGTNGDLVVVAASGTLAEWLRGGMPFTFTKPMDPATAVATTTTSAGTVTLTLVKETGPFVIDAAVSWTSTTEFVVKATNPKDFSGDMIEGATLRVTLTGGPKGGTSSAAALKDATDHTRLDGSPAVGGNVAAQSGDGTQGGDFVVNTQLPT